MILNALAWRVPSFVRRLWAPLRRLWAADPAARTGRTSSALFVFCAAYSYQLIALDDEEFYEAQRPLPLGAQVELAELARHQVRNTDLVVKQRSETVACLTSLCTVAAPPNEAPPSYVSMMYAAVPPLTNTCIITPSFVFNI